MNKLAYIKYSQKEANRKVWDSLVEKYELLKKKNIAIAYCWLPLAFIAFGIVAIFGWFNFLALLFKDIRFTHHYLRTAIEKECTTPKEAIEYLDSQFSEYKTKLSFGNIPLARQKQIEATFEILYNQYKLPEPNLKHEEILSNFTILQQSIKITNKDLQNVGKDINALSFQTKEQNDSISDNLHDITQQTHSISQYTDKKLSEEAEIEKRRTEKEQQKISRYKRDKGRNLDSFESALSDEQISTLTEYCNNIPVFTIDIHDYEMKDILTCTHTRPLQTTVNKYVALLFTRLCEEKLICETWKSVATKYKCFISPNGKELTSKDLSSANATSGIIEMEIHDLIEQCIDSIINT